MPEIFFYMDMKHFDKYRSLDPETKRKINSKARILLYKELDKAKKRGGDLSRPELELIEFDSKVKLRYRISQRFRGLPKYIYVYSICTFERSNFIQIL